MQELAEIKPEDISAEKSAGNFLESSSCLKINNREELEKIQPNTIVIIPLEFFVLNHEQPRKIFKTKELVELSESVKQFGNTEPIQGTLRRDPETGHLYVHHVNGERRKRAAAMAGLTHILCLILDSMSDEEVFLRSVTTNTGEKSFAPMEEALIAQKLSKPPFSYTQVKIAHTLSRSLPHISNIMKYLNLLPRYQRLFLDGGMAPGFAMIIARRLQEKQTETFEFLNELSAEYRKKGRTLGVNEAEFRIEQHEKGSKKRTLKAKPRREKRLTSEELLERITRQVIALTRSLDSLAKRSDASIEDLKFVFRQDVAFDLDSLSNKAIEQSNRLNEFD